MGDHYYYDSSRDFDEPEIEPVEEQEPEPEALGDEFPADMYRVWMEAPLGEPPPDEWILEEAA